MQDFADTYLKGSTPKPCVRCNQTVKFRDLLQVARDLGADCMATGHYVQRIIGENGPELHRGTDPGKDQSYFLFATTQEQLDFLRFPLGGKNKDETRKMAVELGLAVAAKPDSQDICFVPTGKYTDVIKKLRPDADDPGEILHVDGRVLGTHKGVMHYTVGQRRGLGIADGSGLDPLFVLRIDAAKKQVIVGPRTRLVKSRVYVKDVNWLGGDDFGASVDGQAVSIKIRSMKPPVPAHFKSEDGETFIELETPMEGVSPGQACVFYDAHNASRTLGGGWITRSE